MIAVIEGPKYILRGMMYDVMSAAAHSPEYCALRCIQKVGNSLILSVLIRSQLETLIPLITPSEARL